MHTKQEALDDLARDIDRADKKMAVDMIMLMLLGPVQVESDREGFESRMKSLFELAKIGCISVLHKADIVPAIRGIAAHDDDTMLEDDAVISSR